MTHLIVCSDRWKERITFTGFISSIVGLFILLTRTAMRSIKYHVLILGGKMNTELPEFCMKKSAKISGRNAALFASVLFSTASALAQLIPPGPGNGWIPFGDAHWVLEDTLLVQNAPGNNWNPSGAYDILGGINVGSSYTFTADFMTDTGISLTITAPIGLEMQFENSSGVIINTLGGFNYFAPVENTWYEGNVTGTAPAGAASIVLTVLFMDNGQTTTEDVYFKNMSLTPLPSPEPSCYALMALGFVFWGLRRQQLTGFHFKK